MRPHRTTRVQLYGDEGGDDEVKDDASGVDSWSNVWAGPLLVGWVRDCHSRRQQ